MCWREEESCSFVSCVQNEENVLQEDEEHTKHLDNSRTGKEAKGSSGSKCGKRLRGKDQRTSRQSIDRCSTRNTTPTHGALQQLQMQQRASGLLPRMLPLVSGQSLLGMLHEQL
jgi:hypothetical protein